MNNLILPLLMVLLLVGCQKKEDTCPAEFYLGEFQLMKESKSYLKYDKGQKLIFVDSSGATLSLKVDTSLLYSGWGSIGKFCDVGVSGRINYHYDTEYHYVEITDEERKIRFHFLLSASPFRPDPLSGMVADVLEVSLEDLVGANGRGSFLISIPVDLGTYPEDYFNHTFFTQETLINKVFEEVYFKEVEWDGLTLRTYVNEDFGLVGFTDPTGVFWRFDRVE